MNQLTNHCIEKFVHNGWTESYDPRIEHLHFKQLAVDGHQVALEILDTTGINQSVSSKDEYVKKGDGFLLVFSITSRSTLDELHDTRDHILHLKSRDNVPIVLVGNKVDLEDHREVPRNKVFAVSYEWGIKHYEASAKTGVGVNEVFVDLCRQIQRIDDGIEAMDEETRETQQKYNKHDGKRQSGNKRGGCSKCILM